MYKTAFQSNLLNTITSLIWRWIASLNIYSIEIKEDPNIYTETKKVVFFVEWRLKMAMTLSPGAYLPLLRISSELKISMSILLSARWVDKNVGCVLCSTHLLPIDVTLCFRNLLLKILLGTLKKTASLNKLIRKEWWSKQNTQQNEHEPFVEILLLYLFITQTKYKRNTHIRFVLFVAVVVVIFLSFSSRSIH